VSRTLVEQIVANAVGHDVSPGSMETVPVDIVMIHDSIAPSAIRILEEDLGETTVFDPARVAVVIDHVAPASTVGVAEKQAKLRAWARAQGLPHFFEAGRGICHQLLIEERLAAPGRIVVGSDSHSTSYGAVAALGTGMGTTDVALALATGRTWMRVPETIRVRCRGRFGPGVSAKDLALRVGRELRADGATYMALEYVGLDFLSVGERTTLASMAVEVGAKAGLVDPAGLPDSFAVPGWLRASLGAPVARELDIDLDELGPQVARPMRVDDVADIEELERVHVDVVYVGTCTNGRIEDLHAVAEQLRGARVAEGTRLVIVPASHETFRAAVADGTVATLLDAGATFGPPGCGACIGRHMGVLAPGEVCLFTGNRNFRGRMGSPEARIYLGSPEVAGATAREGILTSPREGVLS